MPKMNNKLKQLLKTIKTLTTSVKRLVTEDGEEVTCPKVIVDHFIKFFMNFSSNTTKINPPVTIAIIFSNFL